MEALLQWGLDVIRGIQSYANPPLTAFVQIITELGSPVAYLVLIPFIYWCIDEKKSLRLGIAVLISAWLNFTLKYLLDQPRPFFPGYDPSLGMIAEKMGGFPSGHAQNSLVLWIIIASWGKKKLHYILAALFCLLIGFSRLYLGVHFPTDILGGWFFGGIVLCGYFLAGSRIEALLTAHGWRAGMMASAAIAFIMILYRPSADVLMPGGIILGMGTGYILCKRYIGFTAALNKKNAVRYLILLTRFISGIAIMALLYIATGKISAMFRDTGNYQLIVFLRYVIVALWVSAGAPWFCKLLHLANSDEQQ